MPMTVRLSARTERAVNALAVAAARRDRMSSATRWSITRSPTAATLAADAPMTPGSTSSAWSVLARAIERERRASSSPRSSVSRRVRGVLVDAGPLVALLDQRDVHHEPCVAALKTLRDPLVTVWPAFTEAMYLLGSSWRGQKALWSRLETGALTLAPLDEGDAPRMRELMEKYRDLPMDLADAALVRVAEREDLTRIFTLDRRHFSVYRPGRRRRFSILPQ